MKRLFPLAAVFLAGCVVIDSGEQRDDDRDDGLPAASVPAGVLSAARTRVPGFVLDEARMHEHNGMRYYALEGRARGEDCDIDVTPGGRILRIDR